MDSMLGENPICRSYVSFLFSRQGNHVKYCIEAWADVVPILPSIPTMAMPPEHPTRLLKMNIWQKTEQHPTGVSTYYATIWADTSRAQMPDTWTHLIHARIGMPSSVPPDSAWLTIPCR